MKPALRGAIARVVPKWAKAARLRLIGYGQFSGDYASWTEASALTTGYDSPEIVDRVLQATLKARSERGGFERDGVVLEREPSEPGLVDCLREIARERGRLRVIDVGGSLGTTYWRHCRNWRDVPVTWTIVEQKGFVEAGRRHLADSPLRFYETVDEAWRSDEHDVILASTSVQYLEAPHVAIARWRALEPAFLVFNNLPLVDGPRDRLAIQRVPRAIYRASYPVWFFGKSGFMASVTEGYELVRSFESEAVWQIRWADLRSTGLFLRR